MLSSSPRQPSIESRIRRLSGPSGYLEFDHVPNQTNISIDIQKWNILICRYHLYVYLQDGIYFIWSKTIRSRRCFSTISTTCTRPLFQNGAHVGTFHAFTFHKRSLVQSGSFVMMFYCLFSNVITSHKPRSKRTEVILIIKNIVYQQFHFPHPWLCFVHLKKIWNRLNILLNDFKYYLYLDWENTVWKWIMLY